MTTQTIRTIKAGTLRSDLDLTGRELRDVLNLAAEVKHSPRDFESALKGKSAALLFEKPSLRTRFTFELGLQQLGASVVAVDGPIGSREPLRDVARNLRRWVDVLIARTFQQSTVDDLATWSAIPVINALSDVYHPCQALADMLTIREHFGEVGGRKLAFVGDGNNVAQSLMLCAPRLGLNLTVATPKGHGPSESVLVHARRMAQEFGTTLEITTDPIEAVRNSIAVYTDVWASMGQENEVEKRRQVFQPFQINETLLANAPDALFMHCLPAKRGEEVTDEVMESPRSIAFDQAENRLHVQKALLLMLLPQ